MALGCALEVAEEYMEIVNHSAPVLEAIYGYGCAFGHPLDILKTTSPLPEAISNGYNRHESVHPGGRRPSSGSRRSGAGLCRGRSLVLMMCFFTFSQLVYGHAAYLLLIMLDCSIFYSVRSYFNENIHSYSFFSRQSTFTR